MPPAGRRGGPDRRGCRSPAHVTGMPAGVPQHGRDVAHHLVGPGGGGGQHVHVQWTTVWPTVWLSSAASSAWPSSAMSVWTSWPAAAAAGRGCGSFPGPVAQGLDGDHRLCVCSATLEREAHFLCRDTRSILRTSEPFENSSPSVTCRTLISPIWRRRGAIADARRKMTASRRPWRPVVPAGKVAALGVRRRSKNSSKNCRVSTRTVTAMLQARCERVHEFGAGRHSAATVAAAAIAAAIRARAERLAHAVSAAGWTNPAAAPNGSTRLRLGRGTSNGNRTARFPCPPRDPYGSSRSAKACLNVRKSTAGRRASDVSQAAHGLRRAHGVQEGVVPGRQSMKIASPGARSARPPPPDDDPNAFVRLFRRAIPWR